MMFINIMKRISFFLIILTIMQICMSNCSKKGADVSSEAEVIYIDSKKAVKEFDITDMTDTVISIIPLETNDDCLIGHIDKLEIRAGRIYISDNMAKSIFIFDLKGNFIGKIMAFGQGPGEYTEINAMTVTDSFIVINDIRSYKQLLFSLTGKFVKESRLFKELWMMDVFSFNDTLYYVNDFSGSGMGNYLLFSTTFSSDKIDCFLPFEKGFFGVSVNGPQYAIYKEGFSIIYSGIDDVYGYCMDEEKICKKYSVKFADKRVVYRSNDVTKVFDENANGCVFGLNRIYESDQYLFLEINVIGDGEMLCIYDKYNKETVLCNGSLIHQSFNNLFYGINGMIDNQLITWEDARIFKLRYQYTYSLEPFPDENLNVKIKKIADGMLDDDNPIVFICKLKTHR